MSSVYELICENSELSRKNKTMEITLDELSKRVSDLLSVCENKDSELKARDEFIRQYKSRLDESQKNLAEAKGVADRLKGYGMRILCLEEQVTELKEKLAITRDALKEKYYWLETIPVKELSAMSVSFPHYCSILGNIAKTFGVEPEDYPRLPILVNKEVAKLKELKQNFRDLEYAFQRIMDITYKHT